MDDKITESTRAPSILDEADKGRLARLASPCANRNDNHLRIGKLRSGLLRMGAAPQTVLTPPAVIGNSVRRSYDEAAHGDLKT